jgi:hypothetical protein
VARDLNGRCGTCSFYTALRFVDGRGLDDLEGDDDAPREGECMLRCWPPPLKDSATCTHHKPRGSSFKGVLDRKRVAGMPRARREDDEHLEQAKARLLPKEIDIDMDIDEFRNVLREVLRDELGLGETQLGERWRGGELILKPGKEGTQEKRIPLDQLFQKIVMVRDKLRVLEQKVNSAPNLGAEEKVQLQQYITGCYGSLTTFNVLFRDREDWFVGQGGKD